MTVINLVHRAEKLSPKRPKRTTKATSTPALVANPHKRMHDRADPKHESEMTIRSGILSDR
jgi:hypothetical protein